MTERGDLLDNPIWHALTTEQTGFAERAGDAARFQPAVTLLAGLREPGAAALAELTTLVRPGERTGLFLDELPALPAGLAVADHAGLVQMVFEGQAPERASLEGLLELGAVDAPEMLALAEATRPGPFGTRTAELGTFLGLRDGGRLIAMAGQRMRLPGLAEVSAVCTDPAHLGRGLAARLMKAQLALITGTGKGVFLHVRGDNARAIGLYERLGFRIRRRALYVVVTALVD